MMNMVLAVKSYLIAQVYIQKGTCYPEDLIAGRMAARDGQSRDSEDGSRS